jgi:hypothetical protein
MLLRLTDGGYSWADHLLDTLASDPVDEPAFSQNLNLPARKLVARGEGRLLNRVLNEDRRLLTKLMVLGGNPQLQPRCVAPLPAIDDRISVSAWIFRSL